MGFVDESSELLVDHPVDSPFGNDLKFPVKALLFLGLHETQVRVEIIVIYFSRGLIGPPHIFIGCPMVFFLAHVHRFHVSIFFN